MWKLPYQKIRKSLTNSNRISCLSHLGHEEGVCEYLWPFHQQYKTSCFAQYRELTDDTSGSTTSDESAIDNWLKEALLFKDVDTLVDLHESNEGRNSKYNTSWSKCKEY